MNAAGCAVSNDRLDLAKRAVACKHWRWMPGMLTLEGYRLDNAGRLRAEQQGDQLPDLNDPATVGCLLALVREVWHLPPVCVVQWPEENKWIVSFKLASGFQPIAVGESEAAALVNALRLVE
jgi:hypothetical protein